MRVCRSLAQHTARTTSSSTATTSRSPKKTVRIAIMKLVDLLDLHFVISSFRLADRSGLGGGWRLPVCADICNQGKLTTLKMNLQTVCQIRSEINLEMICQIKSEKVRESQICRSPLPVVASRLGVDGQLLPANRYETARFSKHLTRTTHEVSQ